jgi:3-hydroxyacyl-CoA dehydrogenase/enoyl-CoA hydratase/3-hydroxybutyryl-CoA epimerase
MNPPVTHSVDADRVGWIIFDAPGAGANVLDDATRAAFASALEAVLLAAPRAVVIAGAKERIFIAGADLRQLSSLPDAASALGLSREGQALFQRVASSPVPFVCAIHGACAGGGFELALACHWRIASDSPATRVGLPEVGIGTIPGWGGCTRLPRLIGAKAALDHIMRAQLLPAAKALECGLVDEVVPAPELKARAKEAALRLADSGAPARTPPPAPAGGFFSERRGEISLRVRRNYPAAAAAVDTVEKGFGAAIGDALRIEAEGFASVTAGDTCRNLIYGFFVREGARKRALDAWFPSLPAKPAPIRRVGVIGAGVMGSGIAQWLAAKGIGVVMRDVSPQLVERGLGVVQSLLQESVKRSAMSEAEAAAARERIATTTGWEGLRECDLIVEAIVEDLGAKQRLFADLAGVVGDTTILASNTSALPIEEIASAIHRPERAIGIHFFNPVSRMRLVELVLGKETSADTAARALGLVKALGKEPVICRSSPGFIVTRMLFFYLNEAVRLWEAGTPTEVVDAAMRDFGWPMGPLRLIDEVGVDVTAFIFGEMAHYFPGRFRPTRACAALRAEGLKGRKNGSGEGFYSYALRPEAPNDRRTRTLVPQGGMPSADPGEINRALMGVMAAEAELCLAEGVVKAAEDIDFALLAGAAFPSFRGGLMRYAAAERANRPSRAAVHS